MIALKSTSSHCPIPTPLDQPSLHCVSEGLIGSVDVRKAAGQLKLPIGRVEVDWPLAKDASPASTKNKNTFKFPRWKCPQICQGAWISTKAALAGVASRFHRKVWS